MYLITAYFDEQANKTIQRLIDVIATRTGNTFMTDHQVPPHMTISSIEARHADVLRTPFLELAHSDLLKQTKVRFVSPGQLLPYVLYITPIFNMDLQNLSQVVFDKMSEIPETTISRFYRPGSWLPHTTIGKTLDKKQMLEAFQIMQDYFVPFDATIVELGLSAVNPHRDVERFSLVVN